MIKSILAAATVAATTAAAVGYATVTNTSNGVITGCYQKLNGQLRVADLASCTSSELPISWAIQGPQGLQGPAGPAGPQGVPGPRGIQGPAGPGKLYMNSASNHGFITDSCAGLLDLVTMPVSIATPMSFYASAHGTLLRTSPGHVELNPTLELRDATGAVIARHDGTPVQNMGGFYTEFSVKGIMRSPSGFFTLDGAPTISPGDYTLVLVGFVGGQCQGEASVAGMFVDVVGGITN